MNPFLVRATKALLVAILSLIVGFNSVESAGPYLAGVSGTNYVGLVKPQRALSNYTGTPQPSQYSVVWLAR